MNSFFCFIYDISSNNNNNIVYDIFDFITYIIYNVLCFIYNIFNTITIDNIFDCITYIMYIVLCFIYGSFSKNNTIVSDSINFIVPLTYKNSFCFVSDIIFRTTITVTHNFFDLISNNSIVINFFCCFIHDIFRSNITTVYDIVNLVPAISNNSFRSIYYSIVLIIIIDDETYAIRYSGVCYVYSFRNSSISDSSHRSNII
mmetsp:Transcript_3211/g.3622  ORF Transcript_3211/g.3622 Transcript_3211/m.3622 type:complete len:201 (-) Transcript_3211:86-688(-)